MEQMDCSGYEDQFLGTYNGLCMCTKCGAGFEEINYQQHFEECPFGTYKEGIVEQNNIQILPGPEAPQYENYSEFMETLPNEENNVASTEMIPPPPTQQTVPKIRAVASVSGEFVCHICLKKFIKADSLKRHVTFKHENPASFKCEFCEKTFTYKEAHKRHLTFIHLNPFQFTCDICERKFSYFENLTRHVTLIHDNPSSYKCNLCDKTFNVKAVLNNHILRMHTTVRRYKCADCNYATMEKQYYLTHMKKCAPKHNKSISDTDVELLEKKMEDDIVCSVCDLTFQDINSLLDHIKGHINGSKEHVPIIVEPPPVQRTKVTKEKKNLKNDVDSPVESLQPLKVKRVYKKRLIKTPHSKLSDDGVIVNKLIEKRQDLLESKNFNEYSSSASVDWKTSFINGNFQKSTHNFNSKPCEGRFGVENDNYNYAQSESIYSNENPIIEPPLDMKAALAKALTILYQKILVEEDLEKYRCKLCSITCLSATALESHMRRHL